MCWHMWYVEPPYWSLSTLFWENKYEHEDRICWGVMCLSSYCSIRHCWQYATGTFIKWTKFCCMFVPVKWVFSVFLGEGQQHSMSVCNLLYVCMCVFECGGRLKKLTRLECPLQSEDFRGVCVFVGAFWQEEAGTLSRITQQQRNVVQRGISWIKHKPVLGSEEEHFVARLL